MTHGACAVEQEAHIEAVSYKILVDAPLLCNDFIDAPLLRNDLGERDGDFVIFFNLNGSCRREGWRGYMDDCLNLNRARS
jgi:hypothetical protein